MNDERRAHGAVDESSSEQQICESDDHTLIVRTLAPVEPGVIYVSQAGRLSDIVLQIFKI